MNKLVLLQKKCFFLTILDVPKLKCQWKHSNEQILDLKFRAATNILHQKYKIKVK